MFQKVEEAINMLRKDMEDIIKTQIKSPRDEKYNI